MKNARDTSGKTLMVRARVEHDLERFLERADDLWTSDMPGDMEIIETARSDYRYRVIVPREVWGEYLMLTTMDLDYTNVKGTIAPEPARHSAMMSCWSAMGNLQPGGPYGSRTSSLRGGYASLSASITIDPDDSLDDSFKGEESYCEACDWWHQDYESCRMTP